MNVVIAISVIGFALYIFASQLLGKASPSDARKALEAGARLIDVRSPGEYAGGHLPNALNMPVGEVARRAGEIGPRDTPLVVYCRSGARSATAARMLRGLGFSRVLDLGAMSRLGGNHE